MKEGAARYGVGVYAYVLMTNHYHILASPANEGAIPAMIQMLGRLYVRYINKNMAAVVHFGKDVIKHP